MPFFKKTRSVFPSYQQIYKKIKIKKKQQQQANLKNINNKIQKFKAKVNLNQQHRQIAKTLIDQYKREQLYQIPTHQEVSDLAVVNFTKMPKHASSLNEYLENSEEEENNYEAHLRFRKRALERELDGDENELPATKPKKCKQNSDDDEVLYRKLFDNYCNNKQNHKKEQQNRNSNMMENKKKLIQMYLPYVQALANTNVVKWRILN